MADNDKKKLKDRLDEHHLSYTWLINMFHEKGFEVDKSTVSSAVNGTIKGERVEKIITLGHQIIDEYEALFLKNVSS